MSENHDELTSGSRRDFLRGAGVAASGAVLLGGGAAEANAQDAPAPQPQQGGAPVRASAPHATNLGNLGPLADLPGSWRGKGFNLISLPDFHDNKTFRLLLNATMETLDFTLIGGPVPNRGSGQDDISIFGVTYLQRVTDLDTSGALHIEPGIWLKIPITTVPPNGNATLARQATIPHGDSLLATGTVIPRLFNTPPQINPVSSIPTSNPPGPPLGAGYLAPFSNPPMPLPTGFKPGYVQNMNQALLDDLQNDTVVEMEVLQISTDLGDANNPLQGILNIPFVVSNANATHMDAIFWIETIQRPDGSRYLQLQYTQRVILNFKGIDWPHISVATLIKQ
jgi:hypothetical protein